MVARNIFTSVMRVLDEAVGPIEIHLVCDNSAAAAAMRHMYSSNVLVCEELDRLSRKLQEKGSSLLVHSVRSEDNASDAASRNFSLENMSPKQRTMVDEHGRAGPEIIKRCWDEIQAQIRGWRLGAPSTIHQQQQNDVFIRLAFIHCHTGGVGDGTLIAATGFGGSFFTAITLCDYWAQNFRDYISCFAD